MRHRFSAVLDVDTFYHGVVVNGIDLGGMTMDEAREALTTEEQNAEQPFSITLTYKRSELHHHTGRRGPQRGHGRGAGNSV